MARPLIESLEKRDLFAVTVGASVNATAWGGNQVEGQIALNPANPNNLVVVNNTDWSNGSQVIVSRSLDGGKTWAKSLITSAQDRLIANTPRVDARAVFDSYGNLYVAYMCGASYTETRIVVARSTDGGATFAAGNVTYAVAGTQFDPDAPALATGVNPGGGQAIWMSFTDYDARRVRVVSATSTGLGRWTNFGNLTTVSDRWGSYSSISVGPSGQVAVAYQADDSTQGPSALYVAVDPDGLGKVKFGADVLVSTTNVGGWDFIPAQPNRSIDAEPKVAFDKSTKATRGRLYFLYTDENGNETNDTDVFLRYSSDNGRTWTARKRVNDDTTRTSQFLPALSVDPVTGFVGATWYDARASANNTAVQYYGAVSTNGGVSFTANFRISAGTSAQSGASYTSAQMGDLDLGDSTSAVFYNGKLIPVWADNSNSTLNNPDGTKKFDLYTAVIVVS
ncbi:MAG: sialidase family protein [Phycisphaerae bacterium]